ncbi:MAG: Cytochrome c-554 [Deltaproteobacteria bacterium]|jgi:nitrate/TMAO reductase-like tetraheme cytochrome c subunit|nr:Cytochrome c-554 [Deltaproteobacteria bacterium]
MRQIVACTFLFFLLSPTFSLAQNTLLVFSGDLRGEIKPCGCAEEGDMGGLLRRLTFFKKQDPLHENLLYFDLGNNFPEPSEQGDLKIRLIHTALEKLSPEVVLVGPSEWQNGQHWLTPDIPYLLSNQDSKFNFLTSKIISQGNQSLVVFGYLSPGLVYQNKNELPAIMPVSPDLLSEWKEKIGKTSQKFRILLFRGISDELEKFNKSGLFDLIVTGSNNNDELKQVMKIQGGSRYFPMIPTKGQGVLTGKLTQSGKIIPDNQESVPDGLSVSWLRGDIKDAPELLETFRNYDSKVKELFFSNLARKEKHLIDSPFVGNQVCAACHSESAAVWKNSRHADAFATLENEGKHFDPECLECHVVGLMPWAAPENASEAVRKFEGGRGFLSLQLTPHLTNVQCENCHGPAKAHLANSKISPAIKNPDSICADCHQGSHSPLFDFEKYWPKIKH